jgi:hypothetical protein
MSAQLRYIKPLWRHFALSSFAVTVIILSAGLNNIGERGGRQANVALAV